MRSPVPIVFTIPKAVPRPQAQNPLRLTTKVTDVPSQKRTSCIQKRSRNPLYSPASCRESGCCNQSVFIRAEQPSDIRTIHALETAAFGRSEEADIVDMLRADGALWLSQVALLDGEIVGHAAYSLVTITDASNEYRFPALGPIGVVPRLQKRGIGSALIEAGFRAVQDAEYGLLFLVGHTGYYPRFGFRPALPLGFTSDYVTDPRRHAHFMVRIFDESLIGQARGHMRYHQAFAGS